jgi:hypothetical protein
VRTIPHRCDTVAEFARIQLAGEPSAPRLSFCKLSYGSETTRLSLLLTLFAACLASGCSESAQSQAADEQTEATSGELSAADIFNRRILPIMRSEETSCTECHFGGVHLANYIREDQAETFAALRDQGLIDVERPAESKILTFIRRHADNGDELLARVRASELEAFETWISAAVAEPDLLSAESTDVVIGNELPVEVIRHMRSDHVLAAFVEAIWSQTGRCIGCHSPENNARLVSEHGDYISWIHPGDPEATLRQCVEQGIIDPENPESSPLLLKPLAEVEHAGGPKFIRGSQTDQDFRRFLVDYAAIVHQRYQTVEELPHAPELVIVQTPQQVRITDLPEGLDQKLLRTEIYRWEDGAWSETPWGMADGPINGNDRLFQSLVFATAPRGSERAEQYLNDREALLPAGRYRFRIYIDRDGRSQVDRDYTLGEAEYVGEIEHEGDWLPGYQPPLILTAPAID